MAWVRETVPPDVARIAVPPWVMLASLSGVAALSQAFRTVAGIVAPDLERTFDLSAQQLGIFSGAFHLAFGLAQIPVGVALDRFGARRTVGTAFGLTVVGAALTVIAPVFPLLVAGQALIGLGCAPAFLGALFFVAHRYPDNVFAQMSGMVLSLSGVGLLATGTPIAWVIDFWSWRAGFLVLTIASVFIFLSVWLCVDEGPDLENNDRMSLRSIALGAVPIFRQRGILGILALGSVGYAAYITIRGLWAVPLLLERHDIGLAASGHIMSAGSMAAILGPILFGIIGDDDRSRSVWIIGAAFASVVSIAALALSTSLVLDIMMIIGLGLLTGYFVLQFADVRAAYPEELSGRAFGIFNTATFVGVALMQWASGLCWTVADRLDMNPFRFTLIFIAIALALGTFVFRTSRAAPENRHRVRTTAS